MTFIKPLDKCCCESMMDNISDADSSIKYVAKFRELGLKILDGGTSYQLINYCPWCGEKLPISLRDEWFDILDDDLELDDPDDPNIPLEMTTDEWWLKKGL